MANGIVYLKTNDNDNVLCRIVWEETFQEDYRETNKSYLTLSAQLCWRHAAGETIAVNNQRVVRIFNFGDGGEPHKMDSIISGFKFYGEQVWQKVYTRGQEITHDSDGSKRLYIGFYMSVDGGPDCLQVPVQYKEINLTTIDKAATPTTPTFSTKRLLVNGTNSITIKLNPSNSAYRHKLKYNFEGGGKRLIGQSAGISIGNAISSQKTVTFTPPTSLWDYVPNGHRCLFRCETYPPDSDIPIGFEDTELFFYRNSLGNDEVEVWGVDTLNGVFVQGKSSVEVFVKDEIQDPDSYWYLINVTGCVKGGYAGPDNHLATSSLDSSGEQTISVSRLNLRNNTIDEFFSQKINVEPYDYPRFTEVIAQRATDSETTVEVIVKGKISPLSNQNTKSVIVGIEGLEGKTKTVTPEAYDFTQDGVTVTFQDITSNEAFRCKVTLKDLYYEAENGYVVPTAEVTMDFHSSGQGVAFGKVATTEDLLEVDWDLQGNKTITGDEVISKKTFKRKTATGTLVEVLDKINTKDYVTSQGVSDGWRYRKWNSGFAECWGSCSAIGENLTFPSGLFSSTPDVLYSMGAGGKVPVYAYGT